MVRMNRLLITATVALAACCHTGAFAQDEKADLVAALLKAQNVEPAFTEQVAQARRTARTVGEQSLAPLMTEPGVSQAGREAAGRAWERYLAQADALFDVKELTAEWTRAYSRDLSVAELREILAFYQSPVGQKDVAASSAANQALAGWFRAETRRRGGRLQQEFLRALDSAAGLR